MDFKTMYQDKITTAEEAVSEAAATAEEAVSEAAEVVE